MGRTLGIDFGERRVGFALSDPLGIIATAHSVLTCEDARHAANEAERLCRASDVTQIVLGLPVNMDGSRGPAAQKAMAFAELLREKTGLPVALWDERLSTKSAHDILREGGVGGRQRKGLVDKVAAQVLLQHYLDAHESGH